MCSKQQQKKGEKKGSVLIKLSLKHLKNDNFPKVVQAYAQLTVIVFLNVFF